MPKYLIFIIITIASLLFPQPSFAAPSNGSRLPPKGKAEMGYEYNTVFKRPLDRSYGNLKTGCHFFTASAGIFDWLSLDGKIGIGDVGVKGGAHLPKLEFDTGFAGNKIGVKSRHSTFLFP